jgi:hypothetical protein
MFYNIASIDNVNLFSSLLLEEQNKLDFLSLAAFTNSVFYKRVIRILPEWIL